MRLQKQESGYKIWLSANDIFRWANAPGARWPCSTLKGHRVFAKIDSNGLCDFTLDGKFGKHDIDGIELEACIAYHLPKDYHKLWPVWN